MNYSEFLKTWRGVRLENMVSRVVILTLVVVIGVLAMALMNVRRVVIVQPLHVPEQVELAADHASPEYLKAIAMYLADMLGNVRSGDAEVLREALEPLLDPSIAQAVMKVIGDQVAEIVQDRVYLTFDPKKVIYEPETDRYFVFGTQTARGPAGKPVQKGRTYEFIFRVQNYRPYVTRIDAYTGEPKLQGSVRTRQPGADQEGEG